MNVRGIVEMKARFVQAAGRQHWLRWVFVTLLAVICLLGCLISNAHAAGNTDTVPVNGSSGDESVAPTILEIPDEVYLLRKNVKQEITLYDNIDNTVIKFNLPVNADVTFGISASGANAMLMVTLYDAGGHTMDMWPVNSKTEIQFGPRLMEAGITILE